MQLDDPHRLARLRGKLTTIEEDRILNGYVERAIELTSAPIGLVSLVMGQIQLFRAAVGLPQELAISRATDRCDSFCQFVVSQGEPFLVENAANDPRVPRPLLENFGVTAYAGVPVYAGGLPVGSLCVIDTKPRSWTLDAIQGLIVLARKVSARLDELADGIEVPPNADDLAANLFSQALVIERSAVEAAPIMRLVQAHCRGDLTPEEFKRGRKALTGVSDYFESLMDSMRSLRESAAHLAAESAE